jgi:hypothetical protein
VLVGVRRPGELPGVAEGVLLPAALRLCVDILRSRKSDNEAIEDCLDVACFCSSALGLIGAALGSGVAVLTLSNDPDGITLSTLLLTDCTEGTGGASSMPFVFRR